MKKLISKLLTETITEKELSELRKWLSDIDNKSKLEDYVKDYYDLNITLLKIDVEKAFDKVLGEVNKKEKPLRRLHMNWIRYAAVVSLLVGSIYFYQEMVSVKTPLLVIPDDAITLQLDNGKIEVLHKDGKSEVVDIEGNIVGTQNKNQLVYNKKQVKEKLAYNTITIPYGKRFEVHLSDGTNVQLNSGSSLKYPVKFIEGEKRQVFLLKGEAYFDVTEDRQHPFVVSTEKMHVRVLGTQFNISSYAEDQFINTVLVEGSVSFYDKNENYNVKTATLLSPGFKAAWEKSNAKIEIEAADTDLYTAWIHGGIRFRHMPFKNILKRLERHYNVSFICNNKEIKSRLFTGSFATETIEEVLLSFNKNYAIDYRIENNKIIIN